MGNWGEMTTISRVISPYFQLVHHDDVNLLNFCVGFLEMQTADALGSANGTPDVVLESSANTGYEGMAHTGNLT